uniref:Teratocyte carboxyl esterase n=1 Tax=Cotesia flavipes TaxID=89805 RepID=A0A8K1YTR9_COTFL|nr:teratocyte carboxyl esterase [Cotesia flavipes]
MMLAFLLLLSVSVVSVFSVDNVVLTNIGPILGQDRGYYNTYFGIPYALVDENKPFGKSLPHPNFTTPFNATDSTVKCPQSIPTPGGILQCLRLNVFVPKTTKKQTPVFVWIHGGGFVFGSGGEYDAKHLVRHDIIVVTINYRLGPYGFLCLNTDEVPGNQGLKDQVTALKWVKKNIAAFGGDPEKVTIAGESYGGGAVELHLYSEAEKLYDKAVIQSGGADAEALIVKENGNAAYTLAKVFQPDVKKEDALNVLVKQDPIEVMKAFGSSGMLLRACLEKKQRKGGNLFTEKSFALYSPEKVKDTHIMIGYNSKETFADFMRLPDDDYAKNIFLEKIKNNFELEGIRLELASQLVKTFYLDHDNISKADMLALEAFASDFMINYPEERAVTRFLNQSAVIYKYVFSYTGNSPYKDVKGVGAYHTEELQFLFDWGTMKELSGDDNILMRDRMTAMWANFVKYGNPTPNQTNILPVVWQRVTSDKSYLDIDRELKMKKDEYKDRMEFWDLFWSFYGRCRKLYRSEPEVAA